MNRSPLTTTPHSFLEDVIYDMGQHRTSCTLVVEKSAKGCHPKLLGLFTERDVVKLTASGAEIKGVKIAEVMTQKLITLQEKEAKDIFCALAIMRQYHIRHLPIVDEEHRLIGVMTPQTIRDTLQPQDLLRIRRVKEAMTTRVIHASTQASVLDLAQKMAERRVSCVVICIEPSDCLLVPIGIVTERDIVQFKSLNVDLENTLAEEVMSSPLLPIHPQDSLWEAHELMQKYRIRRLVVSSSEGELLGLITQTSLLQSLDPAEMTQAVTYLRQTVQDRTEELEKKRKQLQKEMQKRKRAMEKLRLIDSAVQHANDAIVITTAHLNAPGPQIVYVNPAFTTLTGYTPGEVIGKTPRIFQGDDTDRGVLNKMRQCLSEGEPFLGELVNYTKDGQAYILELRISPLRNKNGRITHFVSVQRDITERKEAEARLKEEQEKSERLLLNVLPGVIAERLKQEPGTIADGFAEATVMFADLVNFTKLATQMQPQKLVQMLNDIFSAFDELTEKYGLEKIKTIGDSYMVVAGVPLPRSDHAEAIAELALEMQATLAQFNEQQGTNLNIRIGINSGSVVAGVIGKKKFIYDLWGDTVNTASRMESHGINGGIQISEATYLLLQNKYHCEKRGSIVVKGKGEMTTYLLLDHRVEQLAIA